MSAGPLLYNQNTLSDDDFIVNFVARGDILETLLRRLRAIDPNAADGCHQILIGTRGMGKSSLLRRLAIAINREEDLAALYIPLTFREEQYNVLTLGDFWRNCGESLAEWAEAKGAADLAARLDAALATGAWAGNDASAEQFDKELTQLQRRAVLLVDNLDSILDSLADEDQWVLRRYLQARRGPIMIGAATRALAQSADREAAFYEFFQPHHLEPLNQRETEQCMRALALRRGEHGAPVTRILNTQPERLKTLHTLTGGNPRVLTLIYRLLEASETNGAMADLDMLLDQVTPYYKARIEEYQTPQQRAVIDAIALHWDPITVGTLSQLTNIASTTLSSLLNRLRKDGLIETTEVSGAAAGHQITERFLNIWYLMRHGTRRTKHKLRWLVRFLTVFYSPDDLNHISSRISAPYAEKNCHADYRYAIAEALKHLKSGKNGLESIFDMNEITVDSSVGQPMGGNSGERPHDVATAMALHEQGVDLYQKGDHAGAASAFDDIATRFGDAVEPVLRELVALALVNKGGVLGEMGDLAAAIAVYDSVVARFGDAVEPGLREQAARALFNKGFVLGQMGDLAAAIAVYDSVVARFGDAVEPGLREQVARALANKGVVFGEMGDPAAEIAVCDSVIGRFGDAVEPALREQVARVLVNKGNALGRMGDPAAEIAVYDSVVARFGDAVEPALREQVARALVNKGITHGQMGDPAAEIAVYDSVVGRFGDAVEPGLQEQVARALVNKGITHGQMGDPAAEIAVYDSVIGRFGDAVEPGLREEVARALVNKGGTLGEMGDPAAEIAVYDSVVGRFGDAVESGLQEQVARALFSKGITLADMGDHVAEIAVCDSVIGRFGDAVEPALREPVAWALVNKGFALGRMGDLAAAIAVCDNVVARFGDAAEPALREQVALALVNKGVALGKMGDPAAEIAAYDSVVARFGDAVEPGLREPVARALVSKGVALRQMGDPAAAIAAYDVVVARFGDAAEPALRDQVALALVNKGGTLGRMGDYAAAIAACDSVVARFGDAAEPALQEGVARALVNKGVALGQMGDPAAEIAVYDRVVARFGDALEPGLQEPVARARISLANLLLDTGVDPAGAEEHYRAAASVSPLLACTNLAWLYLLDGRTGAARALWDEVKKLPPYGRSLLDSALAVSEDNFGLASEALASVLTGGLDDGGWRFEDDLNRLIRLVEQKGYGERLIAWFEETGFAEQAAPVYVALKAYIRGEALLLDVNPEVRNPAQKIFDQLDAPRRNRRQTAPEPAKPRRRGRPRKT